MASFKALVFEHHFKSDGTVRIKIRVTHNRKSAYIDTGLTATRSDINKKGEIRTIAFIDHCNSLISKFRNRCNQNPELVKSMSVDALINYLQQDEKGIDFIAFARGEIERLKAEGRRGTAENYATAINSLLRFTGATVLYVQDITVQSLRAFESFVRGPENKSRAPGLYLGIIRALHNEIRRQYNDEDAGVIRVPNSPFTKYKLPRDRPPRKRALPAKTVRKILDLPYKPGAIRYNLARDCFALSFYLIGMNSADMYNCPAIRGNKVTYKRMKTRTRRQDEALISLAVPVEAKALVKKYSSVNGFNFRQHYRDENTFNQAINKGLKQIGAELKIHDLEFYSARHSWASIAINECSLDKYLVHESLNHVDESMKITDYYIKKDFGRIDKANRVVLDFMASVEVGKQK